MVTLPPATLPPVAPPAAGAPVPPVVVPVQVVASDLPPTPAPIVVPVQSVQPAPTPAVPAPAPVTPAQLLASLLEQLQQPQPAGAPAPILPPLQLQTPQGTLQVVLPTTVPPQPAVPGQPSAPPATIPQILQALVGGQARLQIVPAPNGAPPALTLLIPPVALRPLADVPQLTPLPQSTNTPAAPLQNFTATLLPRSVAAPYIAALPAVSAEPAASTTTPAAASLLTQLAGKLDTALGTDFKSWLATPTTPEPVAAKTAVPTEASHTATTDLPQTDHPLSLPARIAPTDSTAKPGEQLIATRLLGDTPSGEHLLATDDGHALLVPKAALPAQTPVGRPVTLLVQTGAPAASAAPPQEPIAATHPALAEAISQLANVPATAHLAAQLIVPQDGPVAPPLLFFLAALGLPNLAAPVPNAPRPSRATLHPELEGALETVAAEPLGEAGTSSASGKTEAPSLATRLLAELRQQGATAHDQLGTAWDAYRLPLLPDRTATQSQPLAFYVQQQTLSAPDQDSPQSQQQADRAKQTRFLVDLRLSKLGQTQLEGLSRGRTLDLSLRTDTALPRVIQTDLQQRYAGIASASGLTGTLRFEGSARNLWLRNTNAPAVPLNTRA